jgi:hypothetical protein
MRRKIAGQESVEAVFEARCTASRIRSQRRLRQPETPYLTKKGCQIGSPRALMLPKGGVFGIEDTL